MEDDIKLLAINSGKSELEAETLRQDVELIRIILYIISFITLGFLIYYFGVVWLNTLWFWTYPKFGSPPVPGQFVSNRYVFAWWTIAVMIFNLFPPFALALIAVYPLSRVFSDIHLILLLLAILACLFTFFVLLWFICTANISGNDLNPANDYRYCGVYYNVANQVCPNTTPYNPPVTSAELSINDEFSWQLWTPLVLLAWNIAFQMIVNLRMRYYLRGIRRRFI